MASRLGARVVQPLVVLLAACVSPGAAADSVQYNRQIRPILSENCFSCHGPDQNNRAAGLRLDTADAAADALSPGDPAASEVLARVTTSDHALAMPPAESGKSLTADQIELLRRWIAGGAEYEDHWAFVTPERPPIPAGQAGLVVATPVDAFVARGLAGLGCGQAEQADRGTLIRRVTLDLTGLPPTPDEVQAFKTDARPNAYERLVERLLASPRHGEHMARFWLDAARYGDTHGLHLDNYREMWPYRDWVIRAFNQNMRWDDFVTKQLAGDLLPAATLDDLIATGFNRCHVSTNEGGSINAEVDVRNVVDRVSTTGSVFLGLTTGCAVCHDHKYDPISQKDFYSSYAFFNNIDGPAMDQNTRDTAPSIFAPTEQQSREIERLELAIAEIRSRLTADDDVLRQEQADWLDASRRGDGSEQRVSASLWYSNGPYFGPRRYLNSRSYGPEGKPVSLTDAYDAGRPDRVGWRQRLTWADARLNEGIAGDCSATYLYRAFHTESPVEATAKIRVRGAIKVYLNEAKVHDTLSVDRSIGDEPVELKLPLREGENQLLIQLVNPPGGAGEATPAFEFTWQSPSGQDELPIEVRQAVAADPDALTDAQRELLVGYFRVAVSQDPGVRAAVDSLRASMKALAEAQTRVPTTLVMRERQGDPRPAYVLIRGQYDSPDTELGALKRETPGFLPPLPEGAPADRLGYAQWLLSPEHPLHARVTVNRLWQQFFGVGIVETADDFGMQGAWPSHPELLDWLAVEFRESGWDTRHMIRLMVHSHTYRQSSVQRPEVAAEDPQNRLLASGPRRRLDAEVIRDQSLAVSGLLVNRLGGPSVKPPQPDGLWNAVAYSGSNTNRFRADESPQATHRRSVYTFWKRTAPPPQMAILDAPSRESCTVRRESTNTPLQALLLMNEQQFVECAKSLAARCLRESADAGPSGVAARMFTLATLRAPTQLEVATLVGLYEQSRERYRQDPDAAARLLAVGGPVGGGLHDAPTLAAWTLAANTVLNLDELLVKH